MEKYFCNYNQSLALKKLGFNESCWTYFIIPNSVGEGIFNPSMFLKDYDYLDTMPKHSTYILAPLKSQVFEWFRNEHNLKGFVEPVEYLDDTPETYMWVVYNECHSGAEQLTFEEAESACIDKLIEIIKNK